jgi:hypothetical protein
VAAACAVVPTTAQLAPTLTGTLLASAPPVACSWRKSHHLPALHSVCQIALHAGHRKKWHSGEQQEKAGAKKGAQTDRRKICAERTQQVRERSRGKRVSHIEVFQGVMCFLRGGAQALAAARCRCRSSAAAAVACPYPVRLAPCLSLSTHLSPTPQPPPGPLRHATPLYSCSAPTCVKER